MIDVRRDFDKVDEDKMYLQVVRFLERHPLEDLLNVIGNVITLEGDRLLNAENILRNRTKYEKQLRDGRDN